MRETGVRGVLVYCSDYKCSHSIRLSADHWPDEVRLSDLEPWFVCQACGKRGADVRPDFHWGKPSVAKMGYRAVLAHLTPIATAVLAGSKSAR